MVGAGHHDEAVGGHLSGLDDAGGQDPLDEADVRLAFGDQADDVGRVVHHEGDGDIRPGDVQGDQPAGQQMIGHGDRGSDAQPRLRAGAQCRRGGHHGYRGVHDLSSPIDHR